MDKLPYDFIDKVFTKLDHNTIQNTADQFFNCPLWNEVVRVYKQRLQNYSFTIIPTAIGFSTRIINFNEHGTQTPSSFDNLLQMDDRFMRITLLAIQPKNIGLPAEVPHLPSIATHRLPELLDFVNRFSVESMVVDGDVDDCDYKNHWKGVSEAIAKRKLSASVLELFYFNGAIDFLKNQLQNKQLQKLILHDEVWHAVQSELFSFVCQPHFLSLETDFACFNPSEIKRIINYNDNLAEPWKTATIRMRTQILDVVEGDETAEQWIGDYEEWMFQIDDGEDYPIFEYYSGNNEVLIFFGPCSVSVEFRNFNQVV